MPGVPRRSRGGGLGVAKPGGCSGIPSTTEPIGAVLPLVSARIEPEHRHEPLEGGVTAVHPAPTIGGQSEAVV